jgi:hypothetical protein
VTDHRETPTFIVQLRPLRNVSDPIINLRQALKVLLRRFHLKCVAAHEEKEFAADRARQLEGRAMTSRQRLPNSPADTGGAS